jgi:phage shock protein A
MSTTLFDRIARLMRAEGHGVLEALEERSLLLRQHLREAELALEEKRARVAALAGEETQLGDEIERRRARVGELDGEVALALGGGRDDLARFGIRRLLPERRALEQAQAQREEVVRSRVRLAEALAAQEEAFEALRLRARALLARPASCGDPDALFAPEAVSDEEVELELLRRRSEGAR